MQARIVVLETMIAVLELYEAAPLSREGDYEGAYLKGADFSIRRRLGADFRKAYLEGANFRQADFRQATLTNAIFKGANLSGSDFSEANFVRQSRFVKEVDFRGANLHSVEIKASLANLSQKETFREVMTDEQFNAMVWL